MRHAGGAAARAPVVVLLAVLAVGRAFAAALGDDDQVPVARMLVSTAPQATAVDVHAEHAAALEVQHLQRLVHVHAFGLCAQLWSEAGDFRLGCERAVGRFARRCFRVCFRRRRGRI